MELKAGRELPTEVLESYEELYGRKLQCVCGAVTGLTFDKHKEVMCVDEKACVARCKESPTYQTWKGLRRGFTIPT